VQANPRLHAWLEPSQKPELALGNQHHGKTSLRDHAIIVGFGRVGSTIGSVLRGEHLPFVVIEADRRKLERLRAEGISGVYGDASAAGVLQAAHVGTARLLVIAVPDGFQTRRILELARKANPAIYVIARAHSDSEVAHLKRLEVNRVIMGERELAVGMLTHTLSAFGVDTRRARSIIEEVL
jgi:monovalent cation:H+ antiporter-2, CPA2 family